jgi:tryptophanyl-tRNA synthetase
LPPSSSPFKKERTVIGFDVSQQTLQEIAQSMLEGKKMGRSIENLGDSFVPLTDDPETVELLKTASLHGQEAAKIFGQIYNVIARKALKG